MLNLLSSCSDRGNERRSEIYRGNEPQSCGVLWFIRYAQSRVICIRQTFDWVTTAQHAYWTAPKTHLVRRTVWFWCIGAFSWTPADKLIKTPLSIIFQKKKRDWIWEDKKWHVILMRNQPEVPDNFNHSLFSAVMCAKASVNLFFFFFFPGKIFSLREGLIFKVSYRNSTVWHQLSLVLLGRRRDFLLLEFF